MIQIGKLTKGISRGDVVCEGCRNLILKITDQFSNSVYLDSGSPFLQGLVKVNALKPATCRSIDLSAIRAILRPCGNTEVVLLIIQAIVIPVIHFSAVPDYAQDQVMHSDVSLYPVPFDMRVGIAGSPVYPALPPVAHHQWEVLVVHECDLATFQFYFLHFDQPWGTEKWVKRQRPARLELPP